MKTPKNIFKDGPISPVFIAESIAHHQNKTNIGGHSIFLGQVRADEIDGKTVVAIDYTAHTEMALQRMHEIREDAFAKYSLTCMHVYHSLGKVNAGEICVFVFTSSAHRQMAIDACNYLIVRLKAELSIWGRELFEDESHQWKVNK
jgi:molybdopterin synthase catalytic subunit